MNTLTETRVRIVASSRSWIADEAVRQLYAAAKHEGVLLAAGFPNLHPGKGSPVGAAFVTDSFIYPYLIGGDIGCGMALFKTDLVKRDVKLDRWATQRFDLEHPWEGNVYEFLAECGLESTEFNDTLGTIGSGNHFAELLVAEQILSDGDFRALGIGKQQVLVLVHSGSRGLGESILRECVDEHEGKGFDAESFAAAGYLREHNHAIRWARANRALIAQRFVEALGAQAECLWDACHNSITRQEAEGESVWVHRKGAAPSDSPFVVIPGSRGSLSYIVKPIGDGENHAWSLPNGAGRKWARTEARRRMRERFGIPQLIETPLGSRVICEDRDLLYEEAPAAYKDVEDVVEDLVDAGLVSVIATVRPLLSYKTRTQRR